ncbi:MAG TPA: DUF2993 domain-containing protein [Armatimonadetes bacterium]|nr:DUF2993 domain-containing protein [Armatimonadota bacterium]
MNRHRWQNLFLLAFLPLGFCSCETYDQLREFVQSDTLRKYTESTPLDVTYVSQRMGRWAQRSWERFKGFLGERLGLKRLPVTYSTETEVEAQFTPHIRLRARNFTLADLPVAELSLSLPRTYLSFTRVFAERGLRVASGAAIPLTVRLNEEGLSTYLRQRRPELKETEVTLGEGTVELRLVYQLFGIPLPIKVKGKLAVQDGQRLDLVEPEVWVNEQRLVDKYAQPVVEQFNPVFAVGRDLKLPFRTQLDRVEVRPGEVLLHGQLVFGQGVPQE